MLKTAQLGRGHLAAQRGLSLLEALVSLAILALAVAGMAGVQLKTMVEAQASVRQAQAVRLVDDFAERLKAHGGSPDALATYATGWEAPTSAADCRRAPGCDAAALAQWDLARWKQAIADALPQGRGAAFETPGSERLTVIVAWHDTALQPAATRNAPTSAAPLPRHPHCPAGLLCHFAHVQP